MENYTKLKMILNLLGGDGDKVVADTKKRMQASENGECFHVDADHNLYPIHKEVGYDEYELVGYTFSSWDERLIMRPMSDEERAEEEAREMADWAKSQEERENG